MQRFWWPGYEVQLLGELQRQQNRAQFCDTLLQTEGISVPTHSCVLAALSPYLSQRLSASPSPPYGQKRQLRLQAVTAQTLLKLVGLLYSGELEVKGDREQNDVLAATHQFGIQDLVVGYKDGGIRRVGTPDTGQRIGSCRGATCTEKCKSLKVQDAQVQTEMTGRKENDQADEKTSCVSVGTQTVKVNVVSVGSSTLLSDQTTPPRSSVADVSVPPLSQSGTLNKHCSLTPRPTILSDGESSVGQPTGMAADQTSSSALSSDALPASLQDDPSTRRSDDGNVSQLSSVSGDVMCLSAKESRGQEDGKADGERIDGGNVERPRQESRDEIRGEEKGGSAEKTLSHAKAAMKNFVKMKEMEQISFKLKLKRRTKGEVWEVVGIQDTNEMLSVHTSNKQGYFCHATPQTDLQDVPTASSSAQSSQKPETQNLHPVIPGSPKSPKQPSSSPGSHPLTSSAVAVNQSNALEPLVHPEPPGSVEESDEQIERLLEDIMMGLNILPDLDSERKKSHPMSSAEASSFCHIPASENGVGQNHVHAVGGPAGCVFFQDLETRSSSSSSDTGIPCFCGAEKKTVQPEGLMQQYRPQFSSSVRSSGQSDEMSFQDPSRSERSLYSGTATTESVMPLPCCPDGQKRGYSALEQSSSQEDSSIIDFLPLQPEHASSLSCMDDLRLPQRLSPLETLTNLAANPGNDLRQQLVLQRRPWLTDAPHSLQFPLSAMTGNKNAPLRKREKSHDSKEKNGNSGADERTVNNVEEGGTYSAADVTSDPKVVKKRSKFVHETARDSAAPKRSIQKCEELPQDGDGSFLATKKSKVIVGTEVFIVRTVSNNDVLVTGKETETVSSNKPCPVSEKPEENASVTQTVSEKARGPENLRTERPRIRTRGFLKRSQENTSDSVPPDVHVSAPAVRRDSAAKKEMASLLQRKRGRPRKIKLEESSSLDVHAITESKSQETIKQQLYKDLPKSEEDETERRRCIKEKRNPSETEAAPPKESVGAECDERAEADKDAKHCGVTKQSWMTTLKEFQKLIRQNHPSSRKSKVSESAGGAESERTVKTDLADESAGEPIKESAQTDDRGSLDAAVDENHNQLFNVSPAHCNQSHGDDARSSSSKESASSHGDRPRTSDVSEEQSVTLLNEREQRRKKPCEDFCASGGPDEKPPSAIDGGESLSGSLPPQDNTTTLSHDSHPQTPEKSAPLALGADGIGTMSSQEEEEVEIDVVLYSPEKKPTPREYEGRLTDMAVTPDEEEEEDDVIDIDVTGD